MADISSITLPNGSTYSFKDTTARASGKVSGVKGKKESEYRTGNVNLTPENIGAYAFGNEVSHRREGGTSLDPYYVTFNANKYTLDFPQLIRAVGGVGDWFYSAYLNPDMTVTCNYNNVAMSTLFNPSASSSVLIPVNDLATNPFTITVEKTSAGNITATDVTHMILFEHTLNNTSARLTDYKLELLTTGSSANTGTYSWQTVYQRTGVSDIINGLTMPMNDTAYPYLYFRGVRFTVSGATPIQSNNSSGWGYNCFDLALFCLFDTRPAFSAARSIGALDIAGGSVYGPVSFVSTITGNLNGNASTATKATQDESGNNIKASYASSISISDNVITLKNKNGSSLGTVTVPANGATYTATTSKMVTTTVPNVTSVGSAPTLGTAIPADDITSWTTNTPTSFSVTDKKLSITSGTAASLSYTAKSIPNVTSVGSAPTLGTAITVATGSLNQNGSGATVVTGITAS